MESYLYTPYTHRQQETTRDTQLELDLQKIFRSWQRIIINWKTFQNLLLFYLCSSMGKGVVVLNKVKELFKSWDKFVFME